VRSFPRPSSDGGGLCDLSRTRRSARASCSPTTLSRKELPPAWKASWSLADVDTVPHRVPLAGPHWRRTRSRHSEAGRASCCSTSESARQALRVTPEARNKIRIEERTRSRRDCARARRRRLSPSAHRCKIRGRAIEARGEAGPATPASRSGSPRARDRIRSSSRIRALLASAQEAATRPEGLQALVSGPRAGLTRGTSGAVWRGDLRATAQCTHVPLRSEAWDLGSGGTSKAAEHRRWPEINRIPHADRAWPASTRALCAGVGPPSVRR